MKPRNLSKHGYLNIVCSSRFAFLFQCVAAAAILLAPMAAAGQGVTVCPPKAKVLHLSAADSGDSVPGPVCIQIPVNVLRYSPTIKLSTAIAAGPDITSPFPAAAGGNVQVLPDEIAKDVQAIKEQRQQWNLLQQRNAAAMLALNIGLTRLRELVSTSDILFASGGAQSVLDAFNGAVLTKALDDAGKAVWNNSQLISNALKTVQLDIADRLLAQTSPSDADKNRLTGAETELEAALTDLAPAMPSGADTVGFLKQERLLEWWKNYINGINSPDKFVVSRYVSCNVFGNQTKTVSATLSRIDLLPLFDGSAPANADLASATIAVACASPFAVSAGVDFSFVGNSTFALVPSGTSGNNVFGISSGSRVSPMALAMAHIRIAETSDHKLGLYPGFGVAAHTQDAGAGGTGPEYLAGVGVALFRTVFITPGWQLGRVASLGGGYSLGAAVPSTVTAVPVKTSYASGFGLAITFTKP